MNPKRANESRNNSSSKRVRQQEDRSQGRQQEDRSQGSVEGTYLSININNLYNFIFLVIVYYYIIASNVAVDRVTLQRMLSKLSTIEYKINATDLKLSAIKEKVSKIEDRLKNEPNDETIITVINKINFPIVILIV